MTGSGSATVNGFHLIWNAGLPWDLPQAFKTYLRRYGDLIPPGLTKVVLSRDVRSHAYPLYLIQHGGPGTGELLVHVTSRDWVTMPEMREEIFVNVILLLDNLCAGLIQATASDELVVAGMAFPAEDVMNSLHMIARTYVELRTRCGLDHNRSSGECCTHLQQMMAKFLPRLNSQWP
jgi:hypothetical protein